MTLTNFPFNKWLDLPRWRGQRVEHFKFEWINGVTDETLGWLQPLKNSSPPQLTHDTGQSIKRQLQLALGVRDTAEINPITDRILPWMYVGSDVWPLGRYMFTDDTRAISTGGDRGSFTLLDEGFAFDQQLSEAFGPKVSVNEATIRLASQVSFLKLKFEPTSFTAVGTFQAGTNRGQAMEAYTTQGDYFPYWFDHDGFMRLIRTRDPSKEIPDLDYDDNPRVRAGSITQTSDVLNAPNRFVVIGNSSGAADAPLVGKYDVPPSAPHSIANRGFVIPDVFNAQVTTAAQAQAMATNRGIRQTIYERIAFETPIDPRHDSYNIVHFRGTNWLELSWSITMLPGASMRHLVRKAYG